ncbi:MAG: rhodanese-like domain-containing protein [SAR202 cluster bacterium]|nr:MAG: rhodanese-like domain-containing protein [SAR202 cluster bacterium]
MGAQILQDMGFDNVTYMEGGMEAWKEAGLPTKE